MELKIANAQVIVNYAAFLEENKYFEESFKVGLSARCVPVYGHALIEYPLL